MSSCGQMKVKWWELVVIVGAHIVMWWLWWCYVFGIGLVKNRSKTGERVLKQATVGISIIKMSN